MSDQLIDFKKIEDWCIQVFTKSDVPVGDSEIIAKALVATSLWGIDSHGIARVTHYLKRFENGTLNKYPNVEFVKTASATAQLDGDDGHGIVIMTKATNHAIELAREAGVGIVGVGNSSHCGAIGLYTRKITEQGMVGIAFTHTDSLVVPHGGTKPFFGTNPVSIAFPTENNSEPICLDMATSIVPWNYIMNARRESVGVPVGLGVDKDGKDSENADEIRALKPIASYKGYALAFMIEMLCGPLNGMDYGPNVTSMYGELDKKRKLGSLVIAIDPRRFGGRDNLRHTGTKIISHLRDEGEQILFPGQPEYIVKKERLENGIPVPDSVLEDFKIWSIKLGVQPLT